MRTFEELIRIANTLIKQLSLKVEIITPEMARVYLNTSVGNSHDTTLKTYGVYADSHLNLVCTREYYLGLVS